MDSDSARERRDQKKGFLPKPRFIASSVFRSQQKWLLSVFLGIGIFLSTAVGVFYYSLSRGPINLSWLAPEIVASLSELSGGQFTFQLADASIIKSDKGPTISVKGLVIKAEGHAILAAPRAQLSLDYLALLIGKVKPRSLDVLDLDLNLVVLPDGSVAVSAGADRLETKPFKNPALEAAKANATPHVALLRTAAAALRGIMDLATSPDSEIGSLVHVGVIHGRLIVDDRTNDRSFKYSDVTVSLNRSKKGLLLNLAAAGPNGNWTAEAIANGEPGNTRDFRASIKNLSLDEVSLMGGFRVSGFDTDALMSVDLNFTLGSDDDIVQAGGRLKVGPGYFRLDEPDHEPVLIQNIDLSTYWDSSKRKLILAPMTFNAGGFDLALSGIAEPPAELPVGTDPGSDAWTISLRLNKPSKVFPERKGEEIVEINEGVLNARLMNGQGKIYFDKFAFSGPEVQTSLTGELQYRDKFHISYQLDAFDTQIRPIARLWPSHVTPPVRVWFVEHVTAGTIKHAVLSGDFDADAIVAMRYEQPPPDESVHVDAEIIDATVENVLPGMASVKGITGVLHVTGRTSSFQATSGVMETAPGRALSLTQGRFAVSDGALRPTPATLDISLGGNVEAIADILHVPSIAKYASLPVAASSLKGRIDGSLHLDFEVGDFAREEKTKFAIDAKTKDLSVDNLIGKEKLEAAALHVVANSDGLHVDGAGRIYGAPTTMTLQRAFGDKGAAQAQISLVFDDAARQRAGYVIDGLTGPISAIVKTELPIDELKTDVELDFTRTSFDHPIPGLVKAAGTPGRASFHIVRHGDNLALEQFNFEAGASLAQGNIELNKDGALHLAKLSPVRLSPGDEMKLDIQRINDVTKVIVRATNIDARPMLGTIVRAGGDRQKQSSGSRKTNSATTSGNSRAASVLGDYDVDFKSPIVTGHNKQILSNVELKLESRGGRPRTLAFGGGFGQEKIAASIVRNQNNLPQLEIATHDAGSLLSFLDLYRKMESGAISATIQIGQDRADGIVKIHDFYVKGEPMMRQLMAQGGSSRIDERGNARFDPDSVQVGQLLANFTWTGGRLSIHEGVLSGPAIGLTFDGFLDMPHDRLDIAGSYVPAYALNSLLSNIPVLGVVITGGQHEGIFALNYRLTGAISSPVITVNPLSVIAPGLMRKIMGVIDGTSHIPGAAQ